MSYLIIHFYSFFWPNKHGKESENMIIKHLVDARN